MTRLNRSTRGATPIPGAGLRRGEPEKEKERMSDSERDCNRILFHNYQHALKLWHYWNRRGATEKEKERMSDSELLEWELKHGPTHPDFSFRPDMATAVVDLSPRARREYERQLREHRADVELQWTMNGL